MALTITKVECWVHRAPIATPLANAFAAMTNRPATWLRITASDGAWGWGEVFSNFADTFYRFAVGVFLAGWLISWINFVRRPPTDREILERWIPGAKAGMTLCNLATAGSVPLVSADIASISRAIEALETWGG